MRWPVTDRVRRAVRARGSGPADLVLLYHRVASPVSDPQRLAVSPEHFAEHLEALKTSCDVVPLAALQQGRDQNHRRVRVAVTFDDGYADVASAALPALEAADMPAAVFVATGPVESGRSFWWDELEQRLLRSPVVPEVLVVRVDGVGPFGTRGVFERRLSPSDPSIDSAWHVDDAGTPECRQIAYRDLCAGMRRLNRVARESVLDQVAVQCPGQLTSFAPPMTPGEVRALAAHPLVTVGGHSVSHPSLASLNPDEVESEVATCRDQLRAWTGRAIDTFAYPFGGSRDVTTPVVDAVRRAGYSTALVNQPGRVTASTPAMRWPRLLVRDGDGDSLARRMAEW